LISVSKSALPSLQAPATVALPVGPQVVGVSNIGRRTERSERTMEQQRHAVCDHEDMVRIMVGKVDRIPSAARRRISECTRIWLPWSRLAVGSWRPRVADPYFSL
jgi:hypothetical protein